METFLDKNGTYLQRRKMYIGFRKTSLPSSPQYEKPSDVRLAEPRSLSSRPAGPQVQTLSGER